MAIKPFKSIQWPGLPDIYTVPQIDNGLNTEGMAADAAETGRQIGLLKADLDENVTELKSALNSTENDFKIITGNKILYFIDGHYINTGGATADITNLVENSSFRVAIMECQSGDIFTINARGSTAAKTWAFIASDGTVISAVTHNSALENYQLTAPENSAYIVVNDQNTGGVCYYGSKLLNARVTAIETASANKNIDLINISRERPLESGQYYTLQTAIEAVYTYYQKARHGGTIVVFNDTYSTVRAYQYIYNDTIAAAVNFKDPTKWKLINTTTKQAIVVAAYDSSDDAKRNADFVATGENNGIDIINTAIQTLGGGGRIYLRNGTYKSTYGVNILYNNLVLEGESLGVVVQRDGTNAIFSQAARTGVILSNLTINNPISFTSGSEVYTHDCFVQNLYTDSHTHVLNVTYVTPEQGIEGINAAIDSMPTGGKIVLSSGTYTNVVSGSTAGVRFFSTNAKNNITIEGQGYTTIISRSTGTNDVIGNGTGVSNNIVKDVRIAHSITRPAVPDGIKAVRFVGCWINTEYVDETQEPSINICNVGKGHYFETLFDALQSFYAGRTKFDLTDRWEINIYGHIIETKQVNINRDYINFRGHNALVEFRGQKGIHLNLVNESSPYGYGDHETCVEIRDIHFLKTGCYNYYDEPCVNVEKDNVRFYNCIFENASSSPSPFNQGTTQPTTDTVTGSRRHGIEVKTTKYGEECRTEFHGCVAIGSPYGFQNTRGWYLIFGSPKLFDCVGIGGGIGEYGHGILNHRSSKATLVGCVGYAGSKNYRQSAGIRFQASGSSDLTSCIGYGGYGVQYRSDGVSAERVTEICTALGINPSTYVVNGVVQYDQLTNPTPNVHKESDDICAQFTNDDVQIVALGSGTEEGYGISFWAHDGAPKLINCQGYMGSGQNSHGIHAIAYTNPTIIGGYYGVQDILQNLEIVTGANNEAVLTPTNGLNDYTPYAITGMSLTFIGGAAESGSTITVETNETTPTVLVNDFSITGQSSILHIPVTETVVSAGVGLRVWIKVNGTKIAVAANRFILLVQYHYANTGASAVYIGYTATPHIYNAIIKAHGANEAVEVESGRTASVDMFDCAMHGVVDAGVTFTEKTAINGSSNFVI